MAFRLDANHVWLGIGFLGQALFSARFIVQWIASEREKRSVIPHLFWWFSLGGGMTLLLYAIYRADPVFILGQATALDDVLREQAEALNADKQRLLVEREQVRIELATCEDGDVATARVSQALQKFSELLPKEIERYKKAAKLAGVTAQ
jgi:lipid-A-disaccharide synthase-like uncharacterized protein